MKFELYQWNLNVCVKQNNNKFCNNKIDTYYNLAKADLGHIEDNVGVDLHVVNSKYLI